MKNGFLPALAAATSTYLIRIQKHVVYKIIIAYQIIVAD